MPDLLPCPFCGENGKLMNKSNKVFWIQCISIERCLATQINQDSEQEAIDNWNTRHHPEPKRGLDNDELYTEIEKLMLHITDKLDPHWEGFVKEAKKICSKFSPPPANGLVPLDKNELYVFLTGYLERVMVETLSKDICSKFGHKEVVLPSVQELIQLINKTNLGDFDHICKPKSEDFRQGMKEGARNLNKMYKEFIVPKLSGAILSHLQQINGMKE